MIFISGLLQELPTRFPYKMIPTKNGRFLLMLNGYTFSRQSKSNNFYCSKKDAGCKAKVKLGPDGEVIVAPEPEEHMHPRPLYLVKEDGSLKKVNLENRRLPYMSVSERYWAHKPHVDS